MESRHPIDDELRKRLRDLRPNQIAFAKAIGWKQPALNKYINGTGHATIDDVIRMVALIIGIAQQPFTETERRVLKALRAVPEDRREGVAFVMERAAKAHLHVRRQESNAPAARTPPATTNTGRGKR